MELKRQTLKLANSAAWMLGGRRKNIDTAVDNSILKYAKQQIEAIAPFFGVTVILGLTNRCQCKCAHCGSAMHMEDRRKELKRDDILKLIDELGRLGAFQLYLFGGEPLLVRDVAEYVRYARLRGLMVSIDTNGILLDDWMARKLKAADITRVRISIDSVDPKKHDELRGVEGVFDKAVDAFGYCKQHNIECHLSTYATKETLANGEVSRVIDFGKKLGVKVRLLSSIRSGKWANREEVVLTPDEISRLKQSLDPEVAYWEVEMSDSADKPLFCPVKSKRLLYVNAYGDVHPCCYVNSNFGNIREESLLSIAKRMWQPTMFCQTTEGGCGDCVANDQDFMHQLDDWRKESKRTSPQTLKRMEWNNWASGYGDRIDHLLEVNDSFLLSNLDFEGKKVLDVGSGNGRFAKKIAGQAEQITLVDFSAKMIDNAKQELSGIDNITVKHLDFEKDDLDGKYDIVLAISILHHAENPQKVIEKLRSHLAPGGQIVILDRIETSLTKQLFYQWDIVKKHGIVKGVDTFLLNQRLRDYVKSEVYPTYEAFCNQYEKLLPGMTSHIINHIFTIAIWSDS